MKIIALPEDLQNIGTSSIQIFPYITTQNCLKSKINLTKNTFSFLLEGGKEVITEEQSVAIEPSHFLLMKAGNCIMTETISSARQTYKSMLLFFTDEDFLAFLEDQQVDIARSPKSKSFHVSHYDDFIRQFVKSLELIAQLSASLQKDLLPLKFRELMTYLLQRKGASFLLALVNHHGDQVQNFVRMVENNRVNKLTLSELAFLCNMSLSTFKRTFWTHYGTTPGKWFQEQRLDHAAFLLSTSKQRPIELYEEVGYENLSNFTQAFKRRFGMTPRQYQEQKVNL